MESSIIIVCPGCKTKYKLPVTGVTKVSGKKFTCKKCNFSAPFAMLLPKGNAAPQNTSGVLKTRIGGVAPLTEDAASALKTRIGGAMPQSSQSHTVVCNPAEGGRLIVKSNGLIFNLRQGIYTLGRNSSDSTATIKLMPDPYMSRIHAQLTVQKMGNVVRCIIQSLKSDNPVIINGRPLPVNRQAELRNGDDITMGSTQLQYFV